MSFFYVYVLQAIHTPERFYTGMTGNLKQRLAKHNAGEVPHTAKFKPWRVKSQSSTLGISPASQRFARSMMYAALGRDRPAVRKRSTEAFAT
jgi:predicted GIY-YIG superfamily endonuclease